jgi:hypothetical protein
LIAPIMPATVRGVCQRPSLAACWRIAASGSSVRADRYAVTPIRSRAGPSARVCSPTGGLRGASRRRLAVDNAMRGCAADRQAEARRNGGAPSAGPRALFVVEAARVRPTIRRARRRVPREWIGRPLARRRTTTRHGETVAAAGRDPRRDSHHPTRQNPAYQRTSACVKPQPRLVVGRRAVRVASSCSAACCDRQVVRSIPVRWCGRHLRVVTVAPPVPTGCGFSHGARSDPGARTLGAMAGDLPPRSTSDRRLSQRLDARRGSGRRHARRSLHRA